MDVAHLDGLQLFHGLPPEQLALIAEHAVQVDVPAGKELMHDAAVAWDFYVIRSGGAEVRRGDKTLRTLGAGDFFGEVGVLASDRRRTANVVTTSPTTAVKVSAHDLRSILDAAPELAERLRAAAEEREQHQL
jgi:CRP-like cAMP-binding protein